MPKAIFSDFLDYLYRLYPEHDGRSDGDLLDRFVRLRDQAAFTSLVRRHGRMVENACRRILGDRHLAEDCFQATFIVLARQAASIRAHRSLAAWLHAVARRVAHKAQAKLISERKREEEVAAMPRDERPGEHDWQELRAILDEEIGRLPEKCQAPIILCYLEGKSHARAAKELGCPKTTLERRLSRARELLHRSLVRRGVSLSAGALATVLSEKAMGAPLSALAVMNTAKVAAGFVSGSAGAGVTAHALMLAEEAMVGVTAIKSKLTLLVLAVGLAIGGIGLAGFQAAGEKAAPALQGQQPTPKGQAAEPKQEPAAVARDQFGDPLPEGAIARLGALRFRHDGRLTKLALTPDDKTLVGRTMYDVVIWDAATGKERHRWFAGGYPSSVLAISPDGTTLAVDATTPADAAIKITFWNINSGTRGRVFLIPRGDDRDSFLRDLHFLPDGKALVATYLGKAFVIDVESGKTRLTMEGGNSLMFDRFAISPDGKALAAALRSETAPQAEESEQFVQIWNLTSGQMLRAIWQLPADNMQGVIAFSRDGNVLAFAASSGILLFDVKAGKEIGRIDKRLSHPSTLAFTADGTRLLYGSHNGKVIVWDLNNRKTLQQFEGRVRTGGYFSVTSDGKKVAIGTSANFIQFWDPDSGQELLTEFQSHHTWLSKLAYSPDGKTLVSAGAHAHGNVLVWDTATWQHTGTMPGSASTLVFSANGKHLAIVKAGTQYPSNKVDIWDFTVRKIVREITVPIGCVDRALFSLDGNKLFTLDFDRYEAPYLLHQWDMNSGKQERQRAIPSQLLPISVGSDGNTVAAIVRVGGVCVYDAYASRAILRQDKWQYFENVSLSPDGKVLAAWTTENASRGDGTKPRIRLVEVASGQDACQTDELDGSISCVAWSQDGRVLASAERQTHAGSVRLWNTATGKQLAHFADLQAEPTVLTFSPDGKQVACGLNNGTIFILDSRKAVGKSANATKLAEGALRACWSDLSADKASTAHAAIGVLLTVPGQTVAFLRDQLAPIPVEDPAKIQKWITDLDSEKFAVRQAAAKELEKAGGQIKEAVQKAFKGNTSLETRRRLEQILNNQFYPPRTSRTIMVLERIGSAEAKAVLETMAKGAPGARETEEAKASLERLK